MTAPPSAGEQRLQLVDQIFPVEPFFQTSKRRTDPIDVETATSGAHDGGGVVEVLVARGEKLHRDEILGGDDGNRHAADRHCLDAREEKFLETWPSKDDVDRQPTALVDKGNDPRLLGLSFGVWHTNLEARLMQRLNELVDRARSKIDRHIHVGGQPGRAKDDGRLSAEEVPAETESRQRDLQIGEELSERSRRRRHAPRDRSCV